MSKCPNCKKENVIPKEGIDGEGKKLFYAYCPDCDMRGPSHKTAENAIESLKNLDGVIR